MSPWVGADTPGGGAASILNFDGGNTSSDDPSKGFHRSNTNYGSTASDNSTPTVAWGGLPMVTGVSASVIQDLHSTKAAGLKRMPTTETALSGNSQYATGSYYQAGSAFSIDNVPVIVANDMTTWAIPSDQSDYSDHQRPGGLRGFR